MSSVVGTSATIAINGAGGGSTGTGSSIGLSTTENNSIAIGQNCGLFQTGQSNTFIGNNAVNASLSGSGHTVVGFNAAPNLSGNNNTIVGLQAATNLGGGSGNVILGASTGPWLVSGNSNVLVGALAATRLDATGVVAVGTGASGASNAVAVGSGAVASGKGSVAIGGGASANTGGAFNLANRLIGAFSAINAVPGLATYAVQVNADALKLPGGAALTFCTASGSDPAPVWSIAPDRTVGGQNDLVITSSRGAVVSFVNDFRPGLLDFTAQHRCVLTRRKRPSAFEELCDEILGRAGRLVIATGTYRSSAAGATTPTADEAMPEVALSSPKRPRDPRVFGVISACPVAESRLGHVSIRWPTTETERGARDWIVVNAAGEGGIWVTDENGPIRNGDLLTSSATIPGCATRQTRPHRRLVASHTAAKATCDCDFDARRPGPPIKVIPLPSSTCSPSVRVCLVGCVYKF